MKARLLEADPGLARTLPPEAVDALRDELVADVLELPLGEWGPTQPEPDPGHLGYLLIDGLMLRRTAINGAKSGELISRGDLIRPWI